MKSKYTRVIIELIAWSAFIGFPLILFPTFEPYISKGLLHPALKGIIMTHSLLILFYYFNFYFFLPRFYFTKRYPVYFLSVLAYLLALILLLQTDTAYNPISHMHLRYANFVFVASIFVRFLMVFLLSLGLSHIIRLQQSEKEKLQSELSFLKAQINPHFLFNTLNSIYALTVKKSDAAPESVTKLSAIMRYIITEATGDFVSLEKEINYVSAYIDLEKLRLTKKVKLNYTVSGEIRGKQIAPLIFIPLVENAFKHGVSTSEESEINIKIEIVHNKLDLSVYNTTVRPDANNSNGLGIENVKRRLNLLYGGKHILTLKEDEKSFSANLVLVL